MAKKDNTTKAFQADDCPACNDFIDKESIKDIVCGHTAPTQCACNDNITFEPTHKLIIVASHLPKPLKTDKTFFHRMHIVPFDQKGDA